jgi:hypothetical protein
MKIIIKKDIIGPFLIRKKNNFKEVQEYSYDGIIKIGDSLDF